MPTCLLRTAAVALSAAVLTGCGALSLADSTASAGGQRPEPGLIAEPAAGVAPFLTMIDDARHSIELTMYELTDQRVERALAAAAARGVSVRVLLNGGYYDERETTNAPAYAYLARHHVDVHYSSSAFALTHQKTLTVDGTESAIMTLNFVDDYATTRDFALLDRDRADVDAIVRTFNADFADRSIRPPDAGGDLVFSPGAAPAFLRLIDGARHEIELENEEMTDGPIVDALCDAARRGIDLRIVMTGSTESRADLDRLQRCGARVHLFYGQRYYIHAKVVVVDARRALLGSQNFSSTSLDDNRELSVRITNRTVLAALAAALRSDYSRAG